MSPKVSAYVLHCESPNSDLLLWETITSLGESDYENLEVYVVENGCEVSWLPVDSRLHLPANVGVAKGFNACLGTGSDYTLLLNNDVRVDKEMVSRLVDTGERFGDCGIVCPRIFYYGTKKIWYDGGIFNEWTGVTRHKNIRKIGPPDSKAQETDYATGCCMLIKSDCIKRVGYFDEAYSPAYSEDADYSLRARQAGFKIMVTPKAKLWHKISQSIKILEG